VRIVKFEKEHLELIIPREKQCVQDDYVERGGEIGLLGIGYTIIDSDIIIGCGGVVDMHDGVGEVWTVIGEAFTGYKAERTVYSTCKKFINMLDPFYHRLQMCVKADFEEAQRFAEHLGFENEGVMRKFDSQGRDYIRYSKVR